MAFSIDNPDAGDPMCAACRLLVTDRTNVVYTNDGPMHKGCRAEGYRDIACRLLDKLEREGWRPDEVRAMTERIQGLNLADEYTVGGSDGL